MFHYKITASKIVFEVGFPLLYDMVDTLSLLHAFNGPELHHFVVSWLDVRHICLLDSAITSHALRRNFIDLYRDNASDPNLSRSTWTEVSGLQDKKATDLYSLYHWTDRRHLKVKNWLDHVHNAYSFINRRLRPLTTLAESGEPLAGGKRRRTANTSVDCASDYYDVDVLKGFGTYHLTVHHMRELLSFLQLPANGEGAKFLDVGCGCGILSLLVQMMFPKAKVNALDSRGICNSLQLVQKLSHFAPLQQIQFAPVLRRQDLISACTVCNPTHIVCMGGNSDINSIIIEMAETLPSVQFIAFVKPRRSREVMPFKQHGFNRLCSFSAKYAASDNSCTVEVAQRHENLQENCQHFKS